MNAYDSLLRHQKLGLRYRPEITATQNVKGGSQIQDLPGLQNKFKTSLAS